MERARPVIFHRKGCHKCERALDYLQTRAVPHKAVEVAENGDSLHELETTTHQARTPALVYGREHIHDFTVPELASFLQKHQLDHKTIR